MKSLKLLPVLFLLLSLSACHNEENQSAQAPSRILTTATLEGEWKLVNVSGGLVGTNDHFPAGLITWKINGISQTIVIVNNNTNDQLQDILPSGTYHYSFVANEATPELCAMNIQVDGVNLGCYNITANEFTMSQIESDGFMIKLVR
jgi:hypothetical protein